MHFKTLAMASFASAVAGQSLTEALMNTPSLSNLTTYLQLYPSFMSQLGSMSNITLLAPSNDAFTAALDSATGAAIQANNSDIITALFSYHVLNGSYANFTNMPEFVQTALMPGMYANVTGGQAVEALSMGNGTNATTTFFSGLLQNATAMGNSTANFTGGVVHVIDRFLTVPENITNTAVQLNLRSAVGALTVAGLADTLDTMQDVTCFIPDNEAFQAIGASIATMSPQDLASILEYHVVNGTVGYSTMLTNGSMLTTMSGIPLDITISEDGAVFVNSARVLTPNVLVANGVVHVIDNVLNPGNRTAVPDTTASTQAPAFTGASSASDEPFTSGVATATSSINTEAPASAASAATGGSSSSSGGAAMPLETAAMGMAALFGGAAAIMNM